MLQGVDDIESVQLVHSLVEVEELADILYGVAQRHGKGVTEQAVNREVSVCDYVVAQTAVAEGNGEEEVVLCRLLSSKPSGTYSLLG